MLFKRPAGMDRETFRSRVKDITDWFQPLLPYSSGRLFELESQNWVLADGKPVHGQWEPLYCLAVSSKRYALYNLVDGEVIIRKFSAHGTGDMVNPPTYESKTPEPVEGLLYDCGPRWKYDLWYNALVDVLRYSDVGVNVHGEYLDQPTMMRATISTAHLLKQYTDISGIRPFSFITVLPALSAWNIKNREQCNGVDSHEWRTIMDAKTGMEIRIPWDDDDDVESPSYDGLKDVTFYAPFATRFEDIKDSIRRSDTGELVKGIKHKTLLERLAGYFRRKELKFYPSDGLGMLVRRHVHVVEHVYIGKESRDIKEALLEESGDTIGHYTHSDTPEYARTGVAELVATVGAAALARRKREYRGER